MPVCIPQCQCLTKAGVQCKNRALEGESVCSLHKECQIKWQEAQQKPEQKPEPEVIQGEIPYTHELKMKMVTYVKNKMSELGNAQGKTNKARIAMQLYDTLSQSEGLIFLNNNLPFQFTAIMKLMYFIEFENLTSMIPFYEKITKEKWNPTPETATAIQLYEQYNSPHNVEKYYEYLVTRGGQKFLNSSPYIREINRQYLLFKVKIMGQTSLKPFYIQLFGSRDLI